MNGPAEEVVGDRVGAEPANQRQFYPCKSKSSRLFRSDRAHEKGLFPRHEAYRCGFRRPYS